METILETRDVRKEFVRPERTIEVLRGIDMKIPRGKFVALTGKSGCGKTTLLQLLGVLDNPSSGSILYKGKALSRLGVMKRSAFRLNEIGFIFQSYQLLPELSSLENVVLAGQLSGKSMSVVRERARTLLEDVKMTHRTNHRPAELSGGEQQRIAIARSLMNDPR
jgi:lipoprotein-releasing system ATP-binding protein